MPPAIPVTLSTMNYGSVVFVGGLAISAAWYFIWGRKHYQGPPAREEEVVNRRGSLIEVAR